MIVDCKHTLKPVVDVAQIVFDEEGTATLVHYDGSEFVVGAGRIKTIEQSSPNAQPSEPIVKGSQQSKAESKPCINTACPINSNKKCGHRYPSQYVSCKEREV